jgi:hypothetical protein
MMAMNIQYTDHSAQTYKLELLIRLMLAKVLVSEFAPF